MSIVNEQGIKEYNVTVKTDMGRMRGVNHAIDLNITEQYNAGKYDHFIIDKIEGADGNSTELTYENMMLVPGKAKRVMLYTLRKTTFFHFGLFNLIQSKGDTYTLVSCGDEYMADIPLYLEDPIDFLINGVLLTQSNKLTEITSIPTIPKEGKLAFNEKNAPVFVRGPIISYDGKTEVLLLEYVWLSDIEEVQGKRTYFIDKKNAMKHLKFFN
jgi:hypothetical protein